MVESFYLTYYLNAGIYVAAGLTALISAMFLYAAISEDSSAFTYLFLYIIVNSALIYTSYLFYETAHAYYIPQSRQLVVKNEVEEESEDEPDTEPDTEEEPIVLPEE